ncbi:hypothetical protein ACRRVD_03405 [Candidatus Cardinium hertigii]|uniref:hypothetical protein n=1 Tax=Candidatus Cardinium hertigii TaxID=247481 RepID=UPI003D7C3F68
MTPEFIKIKSINREIFGLNIVFLAAYVLFSAKMCTYNTSELDKVKSISKSNADSSDKLIIYECLGSTKVGDMNSNEPEKNINIDSDTLNFSISSQNFSLKSTFDENKEHEKFLNQSIN